MPIITLKNVPGRGAVIEVVLAPTSGRSEAIRAAGGPAPLPVVVPALLDTGASRSVIDRSLAVELDLEPQGLTYLGTSTTGADRLLRPMFALRFSWARPVVQPAHESLTVVASDLAPLGARALIGRDVLSRCVLIDNGPHDEFTLAY